MRLILSFLLVLFINTVAISQYPKQLSNAKQQAQLLANAAINKEYATVVKYTHPALVKNMGGAAKMQQKLPEIDKKLTQSGVSIKSVTIGDVLSIIKVKNEFICSLLQTSEMKMQMGRIIVKTTVIGVSTDNGITWVFADATGRDRTALQKIIPNLNDKVIIAKREEPKFLTD